MKVIAPKVGDIVYSKEFPKKRYKIIGIIFDPIRGGKEYYYLEDQDTKEIIMGLCDWYQPEDISNEKLWRQMWEPSETSLTSELELEKKASKINEKEKEMIIDEIGSYIYRTTGYDISSFLKEATIKKKDNYYFIEKGNKKLIVEAFNNKVRRCRYILNNKLTTPKKFLFSTGMIVIKKAGNDYVVNIDGEIVYLFDEDLRQFCKDWGFDLRNVLSSISKSGKFTYKIEEND